MPKESSSLFYIEVKGLHLKIHGTYILRGISFKVKKGEIFTIVGPSGSGKSSLLRCLNRLEEPTRGDVLLLGKSILKMEPKKLRKRVGIVFQIPTLFDGTVEDNIAFGPRLHNKSDIRKRVKESIQAVGLPLPILKKDASELSVGQGQRVCLARAIANEPKVLLMDEPTSALDPKAREGIEGLIRDLNRELGLTFVVVTHDMAQARRIGTTSLLLEDGKVKDVLSSDEFFRKYQDHICCVRDG